MLHNGGYQNYRFGRYIGSIVRMDRRRMYHLILDRPTIRDPNIRQTIHWDHTMINPDHIP